MPDHQQLVDSHVYVIDTICCCMKGSRFDFWLHAFTSAFSDSG